MMSRQQQQLRQQHQQHQQDQYSKALYELSVLVLNLLRSPPSSVVPYSNRSPALSRPPRRLPSHASMMSQITPSGFASFLLGVSLSLMLGGSVTFFIGFMLMPWVLGLVMVLYVAGVVSTVSMVGKAVLCYALAPSSSSSSSSSQKDIPAWKLL